MQQLSKNNSTLLFIMLTGLLVVVAFISYTKVLKFNKSVDLVMHTNLVKNKIVEVVSNIKDAEIGQRGYLVTDDSVFLQPINGIEERSNLVFASLDSLISDNPGQQVNLKKLKKLVDERYFILKANIKLLKNNPSHLLLASALLNGKNKMDEVRKQVAFMLQAEDKLLVERTYVKDRTAAITPIFLLVLSLFSILAITLFFLRLQKETSERISITESNILLQEAKQQIEESEAKFRNLILQAPVLIGTIKGSSFNIETINKKALEIWGKSYEQVVHKPLFDLSPELETGLKNILHDVYTSGKPFFANEIQLLLKRTGKADTAYFNLVFQPLRDLDKNIYGIIIIGAEVTEAVNARKMIEASEMRFSNILTQSLMAIAILKGPELVVEFANEPMIITWRKGRDIIGKPVIEIMPEMKEQPFTEMLLQVYKTGVPYYGYEVKTINIQNGKELELYYNFVYQPYTEADNTITGVTIMATEVTEQVLLKKQNEESEAFNRSVLESSPDCLKVLDIEGRIQYMNLNGLCQMEIDDFSAFKNKNWRTFWGSENEAVVNAAVDKALKGETAQFTALCPTAKGTLKWWDVVVSPVGKPGEPVQQIISVSRDITEQKEAEEKLKESEAKFRTLSETVPHMIWTASPEGKKNFFNQFFLEYTGLSFEELKEGGTLKIIFPDDIEKDLQLWNHSLKTGEDFIMEKRLRRHDATYRWHLSHAIAQKDIHGNIIGWIGSSTEIEEQKRFAEELETKVKERTAELEERKNFVETILDTSKEYIAVYAKDFTLLSINKAVENMMGKKRVELIGKKLLEFLPHAKGTKSEKDLQSAFNGNIVHNEPYQSIVTGRYIENYIYPLRNNDGNVYAALAVANDVTNIILKQKEIETANNLLQLQNQTFELAESIAKFGSYTWNITTGSLEYSDNLFRLLDCEPEEFVPSFEKFLSFIHPDDLQQVIQNGEQTMQTGVLVETPYRIISKTRTIKYLRSSGKFSGEGANQILIGTVQDISNDVAGSKELKTKNLELENANNELASFNYVASHDLQEPLRKIQIFSKRIIDNDGEKLSDTTKDYFKRILAATERMRNLIESLLSFSRTNTKEVVFETTDLNETLLDVNTVLNELIMQKNAVIESQTLPVLNAVPVQMHQLFLNLIGNSLKYSKPGVAPHIKIIAEKVAINEVVEGITQKATFWKIVISDNGIGFEQQYEPKIFELFQRLHGKTDYEGTGIGLAICKKIVQLHKGTITATAQLNVGATFTFFLSVNN